MWVVSGSVDSDSLLVSAMSFQKMYGLYGLKHNIVEICGDVTNAGRTEDQLLVKLSVKPSRED